MRFIIYSLLLFLSQPMWAQIEQPHDFLEKLAIAQVEFLEPVEANYKVSKVRQNDFRKHDFALWSPKEKMEIRYEIVPYDTMRYASDIPQMGFMQRLTHLASNEADEAIITVHTPSEKDIVEFFNADWAKEALFIPKKGFGEYGYCKMLSLHKEAVGTAYVYILFDKIDAPWERRYYALRFQ